MDPPTYDTEVDAVHASGSAPALLNLTPRPGEVSFQHGYLGYTTSSIQGSLQLKLTGNDTSYRSHLTEVVVELFGIERLARTAQQRIQPSDDTNAVELFRDTKVLWKREQLSGTTSEGTSLGTSSFPAGNYDFTFQLTDDLPHCCHIGRGSIEYTLRGAIRSSTHPEIQISTPVHLTRTSSPFLPPLTSAQPSPNGGNAQTPRVDPPEIYTSSHPTDVSVFFPHGTSSFRRSESIELRVRIPPPDSTLVQDKGLKLRSVSAELLRKVSINALDNDAEIQSLDEAPSVTTVISKSGKAAAFSSAKSVFLNIWLQPVSADTCESISQWTIFNNIQFSIRVNVSFVGKQGDRQDVVVFDKAVTILPDLPPDLDRSTVNSTALRTPTTPRTPASKPPPPPLNLSASLLRAFWQETEYDGYEEASQRASTEEAPPTIDADEPPPQLEGDEARPPSGSDQILPIPLNPPDFAQSRSPDGADVAPPYSTASGLVLPHTPFSATPPPSTPVHQDDLPAPPPPYERQH